MKKRKQDLEDELAEERRIAQAWLDLHEDDLPPEELPPLPGLAGEVLDVDEPD